jgi:hypothetical protein
MTKSQSRKPEAMKFKVGHCFLVCGNEIIPPGEWILMKLGGTNAELRMINLPSKKSYVIAVLPKKMLSWLEDR